MKSAALLQEAIALEASGNVAEATRRYEKILKREPSNAEALLRLGYACLMHGEFERSAQLVRRVTVLHPSHAPAHNLLGIALDRLGWPDDARACFERAVKADPKFAAAYVNMADALATAGKNEEAVAQYDKALAIEADNIVTWCHRGLALEALGRYLDAVESLQRALALRPDLSEVHFNLANVLHRLQRDDDAITHYRRAIALQPDLSTAHGNLGIALVAAQRWDEAVQSFTQAVKLQPGAADAHFHLGRALWQVERFQESLDSFERALAIDPAHIQALKNKGRLLFVLGRLDEACATTEKAIAVAPDDSENFLDLTSMQKFTAGEPHLASMERLLTQIDGRPLKDQIDLHFALAQAYTSTKNHEKAFAHLVQANTCKRREFNYNESATLENLAGLAEAFTPERMRELAGHGNPSAQPIFIIGMPRSGTTLTEQILASHPRVHGAGEREDFQKALFSVTGRVGDSDAIAALTPALVGQIGSTYLENLSKGAPLTDHITDKMPANFNYAGLIHLALPNARIIHMRRDPIDTCVSCFSVLFANPLGFTYDLGELGRFYRAYEALMAHWRKVLPPGVMLEVQYEDLVDDIESHTRKILDHCDLEWNDACLAFHKTERPVRTASAAQVRQPLYRSSIGRWRAYKDRLQPLFQALELPME